MNVSNQPPLPHTAENVSSIVEFRQAPGGARSVEIRRPCNEHISGIKYEKGRLWGRRADPRAGSIRLRRQRFKGENDN